MAAKWKTCDECKRYFPEDKLTKVNLEEKEQLLCEACKKKITEA